MNELTTAEKQLPDNLEDLAKFTLIGREKLNSVRAEIKAIEKIGLAKEVHEQKLQEAQEIAEAVLDAEMKIGELTSKMEKAKNQYAIDNAVGSKKQQLEKVGIAERTAERFESLAKHPKVVEQAKEDARLEGRIVTRQDVLNRIAPPSKSRRQFMKDFQKQVRVEHEIFTNTSDRKVVNMKEIQRDRQNVEIIKDDVQATITKALSSIMSITAIKKKDFELMRNNITGSERQMMIKMTQNYINIASNLINELGG